MRTKSLLLAAAVSVAGVATSLAQVYSVNAVGYINLTLKPGFTLIANQLDNKNGNLISQVLTGLPDGTVLYKFSNATGTYSIHALDFGAWDPDTSLAPGEGAFILIPAGADQTVTLVGEVPQGDVGMAIPQGFSIISSKVPQTADLSAAGIAFPGADGDVVYRWDPTAGTYGIYAFDFGAWDPTPVIGVGESFFVNKAAASTWTRTFSVNP